VSNQCQVVAHQIDRMASDAEDVRDFAGEIRTEYQERIEVRQNNVINVLTIVTTVFTPLSLVAGWYGMNFVNMPELKIGDAYFILAALMILFIAGEFAIFKRHRWF
jgi:magnesium transporter